MAKTVKRLRFISFVLALDSEDADVKCFQRFCSSHQAGVMLSSNPRLHAMYLGHHLKERLQLRGYIKCMLLYREFAANMLPKVFDDEQIFNEAMRNVERWFLHEQQQKK